LHFWLRDARDGCVGAINAVVCERQGTEGAYRSSGEEGAETKGGEEAMNAVLTMGGLVAVILLYRMVDSYFKDKRND
jgi:hypothetical protein